MKKPLGDVTLYELADECSMHDNCDECPMGNTKLNCWNASKLLKDDLLDVEVEL